MTTKKSQNNFRHSYSPENADLSKAVTLASQGNTRGGALGADGGVGGAGWLSEHRISYARVTRCLKNCGSSSQFTLVSGRTTISQKPHWQRQLSKSKSFHLHQRLKHSCWEVNRFETGHTRRQPRVLKSGGAGKVASGVPYALEARACQAVDNCPVLIIQPSRKHILVCVCSDPTFI